MLSNARLAGKVAIITGAGNGIGAATAKVFAKNGAFLILNDLQHENIESVLSEINQTDQHQIVVGDVPRRNGKSYCSYSNGDLWTY